MILKVIATLSAFVLVAGNLLAGAAVVVKYEKETMKLTVKEGQKERVLQLKKNTHVHDVNGSHLNIKVWPDKLKKDVKLDIEEEKGKLVEINIKK